MDTIRILLVDDDPYFREPLKEWLENQNFTVDEAADSQEALLKVKQAAGNYDAALIDQVLDHGPDGIETMKIIHQLYPNIQVIIFTGWGDQKTGVRALQEGAYRYLLKPVDPVEIDILIRSILEFRKVQRKLELTRKEKDWLDTLLQVTQAMQRQMDDRKKVLRTIAEAGKSLAHADDCAICIRDPINDKFFLTPAGDSKLFSKPFRRAIRKIGRIAMDRGNPVVIPDAEKDERAGSAILAKNICSLLAVPIDGEGILYAFGGKPGQFGNEALYLLEMLASEAGIAIANANLLQEKEQRVRELEKLREVGGLMAEPVELKEVLHRIAEGVRALLKADSAVIWPYESSRKRFAFEQVTVAGLSDEEYQVMKQPLVGGGGITDTIRKTRYRFIEDVENPAYQEFIGMLAQNFYRQTGIKCFAGVALKVAEETVGVLYLNFNRSTQLTQENEDTLKAFATEAAVAIKKARLYLQLHRALNHLETTTDFMRLGKIEDVLRSVSEGVLQALNCDAVTLYRYDENKKTISSLPVTLGLRNETAARKMENLGPDTTLGKILQLGEHYSEDSANDAIMKGRFIERESVCCSAGIALKIVEHTLGILFINFRTPYHFTEEDKHICRTFAALAAMAIRNAELYETDRKWSEHLAHLYEAGKAVTASVDKDEILKTLLDQALEITGISGKKALFGNIMIYHPESDEMVFTHARPEGELETIRRKMGERISFLNNPNGKTGITGKAFKTRRTQWAPDVGKDPDYLPYHPETKSEIAVPLIDRDKNMVIGVLNVEHSEKNGLDANDKKALKMLATQAVIAIQKAEQFEELKQTQKILAGRTALAFMGMASSTWRHEINKYASVISDYISLLEKGLSSTIIKLYRPFVNKIRQMEEYVDTIKKLVALIHNTPITTPLSSEEGVESIQVNALLQERISRALERHELFQGVSDIEVNWELKLPEEARIRVSREWLRRAIDIMIMNALDAMENMPAKVLTLKTLVIQNSAEIRIANSGLPIAEEILKKLFKEPVPKKKEEKGSGMGLLLAQQIVQAYRGEIRVVSANSPLIEFSIALPLEEVYDYAL